MRWKNAGHQSWTGHSECANPCTNMTSKFELLFHSVFSSQRGLAQSNPLMQNLPRKICVHHCSEIQGTGCFNKNTGTKAIFSRWYSDQSGWHLLFDQQHGQVNSLAACKDFLQFMDTHTCSPWWSCIYQRYDNRNPGRICCSRTGSFLCIGKRFLSEITGKRYHIVYLSPQQHPFCKHNNIYGFMAQ